jgi:hypothetical protein
MNWSTTRHRKELNDCNLFIPHSYSEFCVHPGRWLLVQIKKIVNFDEELAGPRPN